MSLMNQNPLLGNNIPNTYTQNIQNISPQDLEYIQQLQQRNNWQMSQRQNVQMSDPYTDFESEFSKCSATVQSKILNNSDFKKAMSECDSLIQATVESLVRPQVMQTPNGRVAFERMLATFRNIKDKYAEEEVQNMEKFHKIMQDEVVQRRLAELEKESGDNQ